MATFSALCKGGRIESALHAWQHATIVAPVLIVLLLTGRN